MIQQNPVAPGKQNQDTWLDATGGGLALIGWRIFEK
jgi:hypothetical protein